MMTTSIGLAPTITVAVVKFALPKLQSQLDVPKLPRAAYLFYVNRKGSVNIAVQPTQPQTDVR